MEYLSDKLHYIKPFSISAYARLYEFQGGVKNLENLFGEMGLTLNSLSFHANEYATVLYFEFDFGDFKSLTKKSNRYQLYRHLMTKFPVRSRVVDWMFDEYIHQTLSGIYQNPESKKTILSLALDDQSSVLTYPSHDFFCLREDLTVKKKVTELKALED